jgi:hypothetical protein
VWGGAGNFRTDVGFEFELLCGHVKARSTVDTVYVEQRHGGQVELGADCGQFLGQGCAFEKAESGAGVKFDVTSGIRGQGLGISRQSRSFAEFLIPDPFSSVIRAFHEPAAGEQVVHQAAETNCFAVS